MIPADGMPSIGANRLPAVTRAEMAEVDRLMIDEFGIDLIQMMENAGLQLASLARAYLGGQAAGRKVGVLAGRGNNGGGAITAARRLIGWGSDVDVILTAPFDEFRGVPRRQLDIVSGLGASIRSFDDGSLNYDLLIDGIIGYGLTGPPRGTPAELIVAANGSDAATISLDVPSGLDVDRPKPAGVAVNAIATLTLALAKPALLDPAARPWVGELFLADIGVPEAVYERLGKKVGPIFSAGSLLRVETGV